MILKQHVKHLSEESRKIYETQLLNRTGFFEESPGVWSSTRFVFIVGSISSLLMAAYMCYTKHGAPNEIGVFLGLSIAALGGTKFFGTKNE